MAKTATKRKPRDKTKQGHLPGLEPPSIKEIDEAAEAYYDLNDESWRMRAKVEQARDELLEVMKKHKFNTYTYDDKSVNVIGKFLVKVKKKKETEE